MKERWIIVHSVSRERLQGTENIYFSSYDAAERYLKANVETLRQWWQILQLIPFTYP